MLASFPVVASRPVVDVGRARRFYTATLGVEPVQMTVPDGALFEAGKRSQFYLYQCARTRADHTAATLNVEDIEQIVDDLTTPCVVFEKHDKGKPKTDTRGIATFGPQRIGLVQERRGKSPRDRVDVG
jgi:hypothetical protein